MAYEAIFHRALGSTNLAAIDKVTQSFFALGEYRKAYTLCQRVAQLRHFSFGAMARGTPVQGTNGAVIPPGRYWLDVIGPEKQKVFGEWKQGKPEVRVETTEDHTDEGRMFYIFTIPSTASNYGMKGVFFPTNVLGFPTIAETSVVSSEQTVQRPDAPTTTDVISTIAHTTGSAAKSFGEGLGLTPLNIVLLIATTIVGVIILSRVTPKIIP